MTPEAPNGSGVHRLITASIPALSWHVQARIFAVHVIKKHGIYGVLFAAAFWFYRQDAIAREAALISVIGSHATAMNANTAVLIEIRDAIIGPEQAVERQPPEPAARPLKPKKRRR